MIKKLFLALILAGLLSGAAFSQKALIFAPWGSGFGQYGQMITPLGARSGPQSLCVGDEGRIYVLDTYNDARVHVYNATGQPLPTLPNKFPSPGYADIAIESNRYLYLLDVANSRVNQIDLALQKQSLVNGDVLGASAPLRKLGMDLRARAYVEDASGNTYGLTPGQGKKLLTPVFRKTPSPESRQVAWRNTRLGFTIKEPEAIQDIHFLWMHPEGIFFFDETIEGGDKPIRRVMGFDKRGWTKSVTLLQPRTEYRVTRDCYVGKDKHVYQLNCSQKGVRILKW